MYRYSVEERVFIVKQYWITSSIKTCRRMFVERFGDQHIPSKCCIQKLVNKMESSGTVLDLHGGGRLPLSEEKVTDV